MSRTEDWSEFVQVPVEAEIVELAGRWKHGWIPLDATAVASKTKGKGVGGKSGNKKWWSSGSRKAGDSSNGAGRKVLKTDDSRFKAQTRSEKEDRPEWSDDDDDDYWEAMGVAPEDRPERNEDDDDDYFQALGERLEPKKVEKVLFRGKARPKKIEIKSETKKDTSKADRTGVVSTMLKAQNSKIRRDADKRTGVLSGGEDELLGSLKSQKKNSPQKFTPADEALMKRLALRKRKHGTHRHPKSPEGAREAHETVTRAKAGGESTQTAVDRRVQKLQALRKSDGRPKA